ncbi:sulfite exporter TauE/SafE family protein [Candidatus Woesearchaeota archaeon]|nr:sulfite exporter TauE/SafE family protein [Candidatus Woesearchaeota archaeon]
MVNFELTSLAFSAGLVSFINPCGFAMLPVYVTYYFKNEGLEKASVIKRAFAGLSLGLTVSLGFATAFSLIGFAISYLGRGLLKYVGWFDLFIGILLVLIGLIYLLNLKAKAYVNRLMNIGEYLKSNKLKNKHISFFVYGVGFAITSLGCTLPIFLLVVTTALKSAGLISGLITFLVYAAGMSFFMVLFSLAVALSKTAVEKTLRRWAPYLYRFGSIVVVIAGIYLIYNQIAFGGLLG